MADERSEHDAAADEVPEDRPPHEHVDGALMLSFGAVYPGRERLAVTMFEEVSRKVGELYSEGRISSFKPFFFADGMLSDVAGFFVLEGRRETLDAVRREEWFQRMLLRAGSAVGNVRVHTLIAGSEAGRLVNMYREVRSELGFVE